MGAYIFRFPAEMPKLTYGHLNVWYLLGGEYRIGGTVTIHLEMPTETAPAHYRLMLYSTVLAWIGKDHVHFAKHGDTHQATRMWLLQIVVDNGIGHSVYRKRGGMLVIDGIQPLEGHTFPVKTS